MSSRGYSAAAIGLAPARAIPPNGGSAVVNPPSGREYEVIGRGTPALPRMTLRKPFWIAVEGPSEWTAPMVQGLRDLFTQGSVTSPCVLLEAPFVGPIVRGLLAGEEHGVLHHQHLVELLARERQLLDAGDLAYLWLCPGPTKTVDLHDPSISNPSAYLGLMGERAIWADVIRMEVDAEPRGEAWTSLVRRAGMALVQRCRIPVAID